jgi:Flp pilus assembly protein TadD
MDFLTPEELHQRAEDHYYDALDLLADGKQDEAIAALQQSLEYDPQFTDAMHGLARALQDASRFDEAITVAQRISEVDPDDVLAHTSLSMLYQRKGMIDEAEAEANKARVLGWKKQLQDRKSGM